VEQGDVLGPDIKLVIYPETGISKKKDMGVKKNDQDHFGKGKSTRSVGGRSGKKKTE